MIVGQEMNVLIPLSNVPESDEPYLTVTLKYITTNSADRETKEKTIEISRKNDNHESRESERQLEIHRHRLSLVSTLRRLMALMNETKIEEAQGLVNELAKTIRASTTAEEVFIQDLLQDLEGQVTEAISKLVRKTYRGPYLLGLVPAVGRTLPTLAFNCALVSTMQ
jgi:hypothetical protein